MKAIKKAIPIIKIIMLIGLCLYLTLSAVFYIYLEMHFFDSSHIRRVFFKILAISSVLWLNLIISISQFIGRNRKNAPSLLMPSLSSLCSLLGCMLFLYLAVCNGGYVWFLALYNLVIVFLSAYDLILRRP